MIENNYRIVDKSSKLRSKHYGGSNNRMEGTDRRYMYKLKILVFYIFKYGAMRVGSFHYTNILEFFNLYNIHYIKSANTYGAVFQIIFANFICTLFLLYLKFFSENF